MSGVIGSTALASTNSGDVISVSNNREILTVNVDQINADLARQASTVLSQHISQDLINSLPPQQHQGVHTSSYTHLSGGGGGPPINAPHHASLLPSSVNPGGGVVSSSGNPPLSLPSHSSRR